MYWLDYTNRNGMYYEDYFVDLGVLKNYVRNGVKRFLLDEIYEFRQKEFSVAIADDEGFLLEYRWGPHEG